MEGNIERGGLEYFELYILPLCANVNFVKKGWNILGISFM
jgi:hypothetical protein